MYSVKSKKVAKTGIVYTGDVFISGILIGTDGVNDPTITVYEGLDNTGEEILPTTTFDASALGLNGYQASVPDDCKNGVYIEIDCDGTVEVTFKYRPRSLVGVS